MIRALFAALALGWASLALPALAVEPDEILDDPALEARAREISAGLRCLVCQNESIDASGADLAKDLRILVRERLVAGDSDDEVRAFMVARYGDFVLYKPPVKSTTWLLWFGPALLVLLAIGIVALTTRVSKRTATPLTAAQRAQAQALIDDHTRPTG